MLFWLILSLIKTIIGQKQSSASQSACTEYTIPFSIRSDQAGSPTLLCASPACSGKKRIYELKRGELIPESETKNMLELGSSFHKAVCQKFYQNNSCSEEDQWTSGILLETNENNFKVKWKCCIYDGLRHASRVKKVILEAGDSYSGGEVYQDGRIVAFDLIKEIELSYNERHRLRYELKILRLACIPKPTDVRHKFTESDASVKDISSEYDAEEYLSTNLHRTTYSKPRRRSTFLEDEEFDDFFAPKHRLAHRRILAFRRRPSIYRPIVEDYNYYDYDPVIIRRPPSAHRRVIANDRLWPINYGIIGRSRPVIAAGAAPSTVYDITSANAFDSDYHHFIDGDSAAASVTSAPAEVYNQQPPTAINDYYSVHNQPSQAEVQPSVGQVLSSYTGAQYQRQPIVVQPESKVAPIAQQSVPSYSGTVPYYNGYFETLQCFSADTTVQTPDRIKRVDELQIGDQILSIEESFISYSPVVMFLHRSHNESAVFNEIILENGNAIKLTDYHLLYVTDCMEGEQLRLIYAKDIQISHCLHVAKKHSNYLVPIQVSNIRRVMGKGVYAPLTATGDIVVNSILSSCHSNIVAQTLQQSVFTLLKRVYSLFHIDSTTGLMPGIHFLTQISDLIIPLSVL